MSRSRWFKRALAGVLTVSAAGGCKQQLFMEPGDYKDATQLALPRTLESNPHAPITPGTVDALGGPVNTVLDFVRPPRYMKLSECIALSLEQGNVGNQAPNNPGIKSETVALFQGRVQAGGSDAIRTFAIDPALASAEIERSLSKFDARWITSMQWQKIDQPVAAQFLAFQQSRDAAQFSSTLAKPLPTGGVAGITFSTDYSKFSQQASQQAPGLVNPNYTPRVQVTLEQPLLRLFGVEVNQLAPTHPGSLLLQGLQPTGQGTEGILITRLRQDQTKANFDVQVNFMLQNVEAAYWNLYAAYYNLYAQEEGLRQAFEGYRYTKLRVEAGAVPPQQADQVQAQFERFRGQVYQARGQVLEAERQLRGHLGLRSDDGVRIVPIDEPNLAPYKPDFTEAANDAIAYRPELLIARQDVKFRQFDLLLQKNLRRPDLRGFAQYDMAGLGTRLDGRTEDFGGNGVITPGNAFGSFIDNRFNSWTLGARLDIPLGFRDANALVRQAQLNMAKSYIQLRDGELKAIEFLTQQYRRVIETHTLIAPRQAEREALQRYVYRIKKALEIGGPKEQDFLSNLTVQQQLAAAIAAETRAIADYNIALAQFEFAKGTIQQYNNVSVGEGALPPWVAKRAADHIRERTEAAFKLREQAMPAGGPAAGGHPVAQAGGTASLLRLPAFAEQREPVPMELPKMGDPKPPVNGGGAPEPRALPGATRAWPEVPGNPRPIDVVRPPAGAGDFRSEGRATLPEVPPYRGAAGAAVGLPTAPTAGGGPIGFQNEGRAALPPEPKLPSAPLWSPPPAGTPADTSAAPPVPPLPGLPPAAPPALPPLPSGQ